MGSSTDANGDLRTQMQEVITQLSQQALATGSLDQLLHDASVGVTETLDTDLCTILEILPNGDEAFFREGVGWHEGIVGSATVPTGVDSQVGNTLHRKEPTIVDNLHADERFSGLELLTSHDVVSGINVLIGSPNNPWGMLATYATERREFTEHEANFVQSVANVLASAIENMQTQSELEEIYGRISDAFFALDKKWRFTYLNERAHEIINPNGQMLVGKNIWEEFPKAIGRKFKSKYEEAMYDQKTVSFEEYYPEPLDAWFEVRAYPSETGLSVYFRDVTERVEREQKLEETVEELEETNERLESFASMLAHELRNPVTIGQIYSQQLPDETDSEAVEYITEAFDRMEAMIDVVLVLTRGRKAVGERTLVDLARVAREVWDDIDTPEATLEVAIDNKIQVDETYIQHLLKNLFENAVEHGGADVTVTVGELPTGFYVADDGAGIPANDRDVVFEVGYTTTAGQGGTGLGLAFVKELADVYEWECAVTESDEGGRDLSSRTLPKGHRGIEQPAPRIYRLSFGQGCRI